MTDVRSLPTGRAASSNDRTSTMMIRATSWALQEGASARTWRPRTSWPPHTMNPADERLSRDLEGVRTIGAPLGRSFAFQTRYEPAGRQSITLTQRYGRAPDRISAIRTERREGGHARRQSRDPERDARKTKARFGSSKHSKCTYTCRLPAAGGPGRETRTP